jgi:hypothetical protein
MSDDTNKQAETVDTNPKKPKSPKDPLGVGLDLGTMNVIAARRTQEGISSKRMRDAFLDLPASAKKMLRLAKTSFVERDDELYILGDAALETANIFGREARRPLSGGLVAAGETEALDVLVLLIKHVLGDPRAPQEVCYFSVPANPIDQPDKDIIYHRGVFERILKDAGYRGIPSNEAMGVIFNECAEDGFSGIALSFGAGMTNVALAINTIEGLSFSVARGGDWIDHGAGSSVGSTKARITAIKEAGVDLNNPQGREQEAIVFYYRNLIEYALDQIALRFKALQGQFALPRPIPLVVSGGTSQAIGFLDFFTEVFETKKKRFPIEVSEIRPAKEPLNAVAYGMLIQALQEYDDG